MKDRKDELLKLVDFNKLRGANRKPRYATRKLSIGLVSCMLGFTLVVSPLVAEAAESGVSDDTMVSDASLDNKDSEKSEVKSDVKEDEAKALPAEDENFKEDVKADDSKDEKANPDEEFKLNPGQIQRLEEAGFSSDQIKLVEDNVRAFLAENKDFDVDGHISDVINTKLANDKREASEAENSEPSNRDGAKKDAETYKAAASKTRVTFKKGSVGEAKDAVDADNLAKLPDATKFEWVNDNIFNGVGDILAEIKVTYPDGSSEIIKAPISITNAYEQDGEMHSGNFFSDEKKAKTTSNGQLNAGFKMDSLESQEARDKKELGMDMSAIYGGGYTASGRNTMDAYLELDDRLAKYVDKIEGSRNGYGTNNYEWKRVRNSRGELTNTWKQKAFSIFAQHGQQDDGSNARDTVFVGDRPEVSVSNPSNKIIFKESIKDIIDKEVPNVENGDLIYRFFIADKDMVIQNQTVSDGTIKVAEEDSEKHPDATAVNNSNWFSGSHSITTYQPDAGENGGFSFDQFLVKNSFGGTLNNYRDQQNKDFAYRFQIDPRLLPYIDSVQAYYMDGSLINGYNSKDFEADNEHSKYFANTYQGLAGRAREGWVEYEMRFNDGEKTQSQYTASPEGTPQTGYRGSKGPAAWFDTNQGAKEKENYRYKDLKPGEGYFTIHNAPIDFGSNQVNFAPATTQASAIRIVANLKKGVDLNKVLKANDGKDSNFGLSAYIVNSAEELIPGTSATGHIRVVDVDGDGQADDIDENVEIPQEKAQSDEYTPVGKNVETEINQVPNPKDGIEKVTDEEGSDVTDKVKDYRWEKTPDVSKEGEFDNAVIITYEDGTSERVPTKIIVKDNREDREKYEPETNEITKEFGNPTTEEEVKDAVKIPAYPADKKAPEIKVDDPSSLPDGKTPGNKEVDVTVTYPDGTSDKVKVPVKVLEESKKLSEAEKYKPEVSTVEKEKGYKVSEKDVTDAVKVPDYKEDPAKPGQKPLVKVDDKSQLPDGKTRGKTMVDVTISYPDGSEDKEKVPVIIKDTKAPEITKPADKILVENKEIDPIKVETNEEDAKVSVDGLPEGLNFDDKSGEITGTAKMDNWAKDEEERDFPAKIEAEDEAGNKSEANFMITVQRDTDGDGNPDSTDPDDDNDGILDEDDKNPKKWDAKVEDKVETPQGTQPKLSQYAEKISNLPKGARAEVVKEADVSKPGETEATLRISLENGEVSEVKVPVIVKENPDTTKPNINGLSDNKERSNPSKEEDKSNKGPQVWADGARVVEGKTIDPINVLVKDDKDENPEVSVEGLPGDLSYNKEAKQIQGRPAKIGDWGDKEEEREFQATIAAKDKAGNQTTKAITITVLRDTDGDGIADTIDDDDDNDGVSDEDEKKAGTNPKDKNSKPDSRTPEKDAEKYEVETKVVEKDKGQKPSEKEIIDSVTVKNYPEDKKKPEVTIDNPKQIPDGKTPGEYEVDVTVKYPDGSEDKTKVKVTIKDENQSEKAKVNQPTEGDDKITGTGVAGAEIIVKDKNGNVIGKTTVDKDGNWEVVLAADKLLNKGDKISVEQTEKGKKPSGSETTVKGKEDSAKPEVNQPTEGDDKITGTGKPGSKIVVKDKDGKIIGETTVDKGGNWKVGVPSEKLLKVGDKLIVEQTEKGKKANATEITVKAKKIKDEGHSITPSIPYLPSTDGEDNPTDDGNKEKDSRTDAEKNPANTPSEKTGVKDKNHLTDEEKQEVIDKVKKANPAVIDVIVDDKGNATLIYADGSKNFINADNLIYQVGAQKENMPNTKGKKAGANVKTGVGSVSGLIGLAGISIAGLLASRKKEEEDK